MRVLVIADDLSGAAEIGGIGCRYGLPTRLMRQRLTPISPGLTVIDTDSRSLAPADAARRGAELVAGLDPASFDFIYKKTDSVLRGPVAAELDALLAALGGERALLVPQNPSRGRVIMGGEYRIDGVPLHETALARDPTHPLRSSNVTELLGPHERPITVADGATDNDLRGLAGRVTPGVLPAGGADFFTALLERAGLVGTRPPLDALPPPPRLYVCGSMMPQPSIPGVAARPMMQDATDVWCDAVCWLLRDGKDAMMTIDRPPDRAPGASARIEATMALAAASVLRRCAAGGVFLTGGATASAVCRQMGWDELAVEGELAGGVVQLRPAHAGAPRLVIKPGSYPWPALVS